QSATLREGQDIRMAEPKKWAKDWLKTTQAIMNAAAKGGILADPDQAEPAMHRYGENMTALDPRRERGRLRLMQESEPFCRNQRNAELAEQELEALRYLIPAG